MKILKFLFVALLFAGLYSCSSDSNGEGGSGSIESITITPNAVSAQVGTPITFVVKTNTNEDVTSSATISAGNTVLTNATLNSNSAAQFVVTANYSGKSATVTVNFTEGPSINFTKRVLIEDYTGTWCGYCPRVAQGIDLVMDQTEFAVPVAIHRGQDPYNFAAGSTLENLIGLQGYPDARLNRLTSWNYPEPNNVSQVLALTEGALPKVGLAMNATITGNNLDLTVKAKFGTSVEGAKLVVYVLENGLIYNQTNYTTYYGGGSTIVGFTHNHVLRATLTNILGDDVPAGESIYDGTFTKTFSVPVPSNITNKTNVEFVAFIVGKDKKAINVRKAVSGDNQSFEIVE